MSPTSYVKYLEAKHSVDDRSINHYVWSAFIQKLNKNHDAGICHILEIGAGTGHTFFKILEAIELSQCLYTVVELEQDHLARLFEKLEGWVKNQGGQIDDVKGERRYIVQLPEKKIEVQLVEQDIEQYLIALDQEETYSAIVGQAIIDLLDIDHVFPLMAGVLKPEGLYYFPISFDGMTSFLPELDKAIDSKVEKIYHESMVHGGIDRSQTGRRTLLYMLKNGLRIESVGSSDWVIYPDTRGMYPGNEKYFLQHILDLVRKEMAASNQIDQGVAEHWYARRVTQLERGELVYIAHQLDILASCE